MITPNAWQTRTPTAEAYLDEGLRQHMLRVYNYMGVGLVLTGIVAFLVGSTPAIYQPIFGTPLKWVVMLAPLAFIFFFSFRIHAISAATAQGLFWTFCALIGLSLASVFLVFTGASIARTFFITAAMFGATSLYGYTTKRDLSTMGSFLFMGLHRRDHRIPGEPIHRLERASVRDFGDRRARIHGSYRLRHAEHQGAVC